LSSEIDSAQLEALRRFERLLAYRAIPAGFIALRDQHRLWDRHIVDSLRALECLGPSDRTLADLGSGAGLPGVPLAIARPDVAVTLVERQLRRVGFLEAAILDLGLANARVEAGAIEETRLEVDACTARALANPALAWSLAERCLTTQGRLIYFAGRSWSGGMVDGGPDSGASPAAVQREICSPGEFPWQGPLVIMRRVLRPFRPH
jgi:16S rRNA (guanine527-N7)-methyltransferase